MKCACGITELQEIYNKGIFEDINPSDNLVETHTEDECWIQQWIRISKKDKGENNDSNETT